MTHFEAAANAAGRPLRTRRALPQQGGGRRAPHPLRRCRDRLRPAVRDPLPCPHRSFRGRRGALRHRGGRSSARPLRARRRIPGRRRTFRPVGPATADDACGGVRGGGAATPRRAHLRAHPGAWRRSLRPCAPRRCGAARIADRGSRPPPRSRGAVVTAAHPCATLAPGRSGRGAADGRPCRRSPSAARRTARRRDRGAPSGGTARGHRPRRVAGGDRQPRPAVRARRHRGGRPLRPRPR